VAFFSFVKIDELFEAADTTLVVFFVIVNKKSLGGMVDNRCWLIER